MKLFGKPRDELRAEPGPLVSAYLSTGVSALDAALGGGFKRGSVTLVQAEGAATGGDFRKLTSSATRTMLSEGSGALVVPTLDETPRQVYDALLAGEERVMPPDRLRIIDYFSERLGEPWLLPLAPTVGRSQALRRMVDAEKHLSGKPRRPFLELMALDTNEKAWATGGAAQAFAHGVERSRQIGNTTLVWIREDSSMLSAARSIADFQLILSRDLNGTSIRGVKPTFPPIVL